MEQLRQNLQSIGSNLLVCFDKPENFIPKLLDPEGHNVVVYQQEVTHEELNVEKALAKKLDKENNELTSVWGLTLHHKDDMDYNPNEYLPHIYGKFRERNLAVKVRPLVPAPQQGELPFL